MATPADDDHAAARAEMVERQIRQRGVRDPAVLHAMATVPRHEFVAEGTERRAHADSALPIGERQTISQPYIVALMCEALQLDRSSRVLDVGTGSGYSAAVLSLLAGRVFSIERHRSLADAARERLQRLGYDVEVRCGDGTLGWPEEAPFDGIVVAAATKDVPPALTEQLVDGGRLVIPLGGRFGGQELVRITRRGSELERTPICLVRFVPLVAD